MCVSDGVASSNGTSPGNRSNPNPRFSLVHTPLGPRKSLIPHAIPIPRMSNPAPFRTPPPAYTSIHPLQCAPPRNAIAGTISPVCPFPSCVLYSYPSHPSMPTIKRNRCVRIALPFSFPFSLPPPTTQPNTHLFLWQSTNTIIYSLSQSRCVTQTAHCPSDPFAVFFCCAISNHAEGLSWGHQRRKAMP